MDETQINREKHIHLPGLNGLRAIAALSVLLSHVFLGTFGNWNLEVVKLPIFEGGVILFFVISGFLITYLLLHEITSTDSIDIKKFYLRRILRIWPLYYGYILIAVIVLTILGLQKDILNNNLVYYLFFGANIPFISSIGIWIIVHYWSLGVEEQFYLFWPWLVKVSRHRIHIITLLILVVWITLKYGTWLLFTNHSLIYRFFAVTCFQSMMLGALGAIVYYHKNKTILALTTNHYVQTITWLYFLFSCFLNEYIPAACRNDVIALFSLLLILGQVVENKIINLEKPIFDFIGKISYGIYVIHPLIIFISSRIWIKMSVNVNPALQYILIFVWVISSTIIIAIISYNYFEKPFLRLKNRYSIIQSCDSIREINQL
ncbi:acyltransferase family protein [Paludibacter jiangxiensis]|uniref:Peptidoglycan/LPS O-acetylase OafA/YrhL n=1 Tax=Paludibacter jiangxiensis TaxID=681398 RepID=A0A161LEA5_9BACT|nr:acyltransferase [Paludibacter jiangxiensis]GAT62875.1 peptidoglycan/LPS O-acetylase OafA/YrhL [Paludibacter jiangxiensis]